MIEVGEWLAKLSDIKASTVHAYLCIIIFVMYLFGKQLLPFIMSLNLANHSPATKPYWSPMYPILILQQY